MGQPRWDISREPNYGGSYALWPPASSAANCAGGARTSAVTYEVLQPWNLGHWIGEASGQMLSRLLNDLSSQIIFDAAADPGRFQSNGAQSVK